MSVSAVSKYAVYTAWRLPPRMFGEIYIVLTGREVPPGQYAAEYFILLQHPLDDLHVGHPIAMPTDSSNIDSVLEEALRHATLDLSDLLEVRAEALGRSDWALLPFELEESERALESCWRRDAFSEQLKVIRRATKCVALSEYLVFLDSSDVGD